MITITAQFTLGYNQKPIGWNVSQFTKHTKNKPLANWLIVSQMVYAFNRWRSISYSTSMMPSYLPAPAQTLIAASFIHSRSSCSYIRRPLRYVPQRHIAERGASCGVWRCRRSQMIVEMPTVRSIVWSV